MTRFLTWQRWNGERIDVAEGFEVNSRGVIDMAELRKPDGGPVKPDLFFIAFDPDTQGHNHVHANNGYMPSFPLPTVSQE